MNVSFAPALTFKVLHLKVMACFRLVIRSQSLNPGSTFLWKVSCESKTKISRVFLNGTLPINKSQSDILKNFRCFSTIWSNVHTLNLQSEYKCFKVCWEWSCWPIWTVFDSSLWWNWLILWGFFNKLKVYGVKISFPTPFTLFKETLMPCARKACALTSHVRVWIPNFPSEFSTFDFTTLLFSDSDFTMFSVLLKSFA